MVKNIINFFTKNLKRELIIAIVLTHAVMMSIFIYDLTKQQKNFLHQQSLSQTKSLTTTIASNSSTWVLSNDYVGMFEIIYSISRYPGVQYAMLLDMDGKILAHTDKKYLNQFISGESYQLIKKTQKELLVLNNDKVIIDIASPIMIKDRQIGWARVGLSQIDNIKGIDGVLEKGIFYTLIAILIAWIFAYILASGFTKSLYKIIDIAKQTTNGKRGLQIKISRNDEIGILSKEINKMFIQLNNDQEKLDNFNRSLEKQIEEKTQSLEYSNQILKEKEKSLQDLNNTLEKRIEEEVSKIKYIQDKLFKSEKLASMGEMIGNIAHQWRQPLSTISVSATGMKMQKEFGSLTDESFNDTCDAINKNAQYLSKTIDDFKNFIKGDRSKRVFNLEDAINSFLHLVEATSKYYNINIILDIKKEIEIDGYENELIQCLINIFNNAKDALKEDTLSKDNRYLFISSSLENEKAIIKIKDNARGIPEKVIAHVFEPYFSTKHKSQGTGLGLHMAYNLIVDGMDGTIEVSNLSYQYDNKSYIGAEFEITLPLV